MKNCFLIFIFAGLVVGCVTNRPYPELIEKNFSPSRGGTIQHIQPRNSEEGHQYKLASRDIMRKFCKQKFKVLSVTGTTETTGYSNTDVNVVAGISVGQSDPIKEDMIRIKFACEMDSD